MRPLCPKQKWFWVSVLATAVWGALHAAVRWVASPTLGRDDAIENIFSQSLQLNYSPRQPPLYDWILWAVHQVLPPTLPSYLLIKYLALTVMVALYFHVAQRILQHPKRAAIATMSLCLLFQVGWNHHIFITHTVLLMLFIPFATLILLQIFERPRLQTYITFGIVCGLGLLSKYGFALFMLMLLAAGIWMRTYRPYILSYKMVLALLIAVGMLSPVLVWYATDAPTGLVDMSVNNMQGMEAETFWQVRLSGLQQLVAGYVNFLLPLAVLVPLIYRARIQPMTQEVRWVWRAMLIGAGCCVLAVMFFGFENFKERYMHPLLLLSPIVIIAALTRESAVQQHRYMLLCIAVFASVSVLARGSILLYSPLCSKNCYELQPYKELRPLLLEYGFEPSHHTLAGMTPFESGNLRMIFPEARVVDLSRPYYTPPGETTGCFVVWRNRQDTQEPSSDHIPITIHWEGRTSYFILARRANACISG